MKIRNDDEEIKRGGERYMESSSSDIVDDQRIYLLMNQVEQCMRSTLDIRAIEKCSLNDENFAFWRYIEILFRTDLLVLYTQKSQISRFLEVRDIDLHVEGSRYLYGRYLVCDTCCPYSFLTKRAIVNMAQKSNNCQELVFQNVSQRRAIVNKQIILT